MSGATLKEQIAQVNQTLERMGEMSNGASGLLVAALADLHIAALAHGAAVSTRYGRRTRRVRAASRRQLEQAARAYFIAVSAVQDLLPPG